MPGRKVACPHCPKVMRSDNLKKHIERHAESTTVVAGRKGAFSPLLSSRYNKNPKIRKLVDAIVNVKDTANNATEKKSKDGSRFALNGMVEVGNDNIRFLNANDPTIKNPKKNVKVLLFVHH